jgi:glycine oxidase
MYADFARELKEASGIDIEYRTEGTLYLSLSEEDDEELDRRWQWQHDAGLNVKRLYAACLLKLEPLLNEGLRWALKFPDDHQVDSRRLIKALTIAAQKSGVSFSTHTDARSLWTDGSRVRGVITPDSKIKSERVIIAAGSWSTLVEPELPEQSGFVRDFRVEPVRGQMVAIEMPAPLLQHVIYSSRAYLVPRLSGYLIAGSTTELVGYNKLTTAGGVQSIITRAIEIAPSLAEQTIVETWAGLRPKIQGDGWPVLGEDIHLNGLLYATGHYRNGILLAPITARAISQVVLKEESSINIRPFSPLRFD